MIQSRPSRSQPAAIPHCGTAKEPAGRRAFTLVELLVVIVIIGILAALILPALSRAKARAVGIACMNNMRQLTLAWLQYAYDNSDRIPYASAFPTGSPADAYVWVTGRIDSDPTNPSNWDPSVDIMKSALWPYCGKSTAIWKCPADRSTIVPAFGPFQGQTLPRVRSMSMSIWQGGWGGTLNPGYPGVTSPPWRLYLKLTDMFTPGPTGMLFVMGSYNSDILVSRLFTNLRRWPKLRKSHAPGSSR